MAMTQRDKKLIVVVPATVALMLYGFAINRSRQIELTGLRRNLEGAQKAAPSRQKLDEKQIQLLKLQAETTKLEMRTTQEQQRWEALAGQCNDTKKRNDRHQKLTTLLAQHHLSLLEDSSHVTDKSCHD